ncbi:MAG: DUF799 family lipoprotein [Deltaproteobacteria bacterium]|nr:DUF799 family lipoprotein [Deltaproteobacteria bacterium]
MRTSFPSQWRPILVAVLFVMQGCILSTDKTAIITDVKTLFEGTYQVDPYMQGNMPRKIAVLPFIDQSRSKEGFATVRKCFYNHFSSMPFQDMEIHTIDHLLRKAGLTDAEEIRKTAPQELGKILNVDAVVFGTVSNFDKIFAVLYSQVATGAEVEMYDTKTGHFLWSGKHTTRIHQGGISTTPVGIIATIIATSMNMRDIQLLRACDDLFRDMVKTIPVPKIADVAEPPVIALLTQDTKGAPKKAGDEIQVVIKGTPRMRAYFNIGDIIKGIDMKEVEPGGYLGSYRVNPGDNTTGAIITGYLTSDAGVTVRWIDAIGSVTLDTEPPSTPKSFSTAGRNGYIYLSWEKVAAADLAGYSIYRSMTPLSGFSEITRTEFAEHKDEGLANFKKYFYRIAAFDAAGNESPLSPTIESMPVTPGPTTVSGVIETDRVWYAGAGPYIIVDPVVVKDRAHLTIEAGAVIQSKGSPIVVEGRITAAGDEKRLINFGGYEGKTWDGIVFHDTKEKENRIAYARISDGRTGILCRSSSPLLEGMEITGNDLGIKVKGAFSKPRIKGSTIHRNKSTGIDVSEGAAPLIEENRINNNGGGGIAIDKAEATIRSNWIIKNERCGISVADGTVIIEKNNIFDNAPFNVKTGQQGKSVIARDNWWGAPEGLAVLKTLEGKVEIPSILNGPYPGGTSIKVPILSNELRGIIAADSYLILSRSPYRVVTDVTIDNGAILHVEPGVTIRYDQERSIVVKKGGIIARGTKEHPIIFTTSANAPAPGFYNKAVNFASRDAGAGSFFEYCKVLYATIAFDIDYGSPEITRCEIAYNSQGGIYCRNDAAPKVFYNTLHHNGGEGAVKCVGMSRPVINNNNIFDNDVAIQAFSTITIDARHNWWGAEKPDEGRIWGAAVVIEPWMKAPVPEAFRVNQ